MLESTLSVYVLRAVCGLIDEETADLRTIPSTESALVNEWHERIRSVLEDDQSAIIIEALLDALSETYAQSGTWYETLRVAELALLQEREDLVEAYAALQASVESLTNQVIVARQENQELRLLAETGFRQHEEAVQKLMLTQSANEALQQTLRQVFGSRSWRFTSRIRSLVSRG